MVFPRCVRVVVQDTSLMRAAFPLIAWSSWFVLYEQGSREAGTWLMVPREDASLVRLCRFGGLSRYRWIFWQRARGKIPREGASLVACAGPVACPVIARLFL